MSTYPLAAIKIKGLEPNYKNKRFEYNLQRFERFERFSHICILSKGNKMGQVRRTLLSMPDICHVTGD